jgi:transposase InsO family protein
MSRKGNRWDNAVNESFFSSLKKERIKKQIPSTATFCSCSARCAVASMPTCRSTRWRREPGGRRSISIAPSRFI